MAHLAPDDLRASLEAEARQRFGEARARALAPELDALAQDLARVAGAPLPRESEPGFFLAAAGDAEA
jgi:hypothetical protein